MCGIHLERSSELRRKKQLHTKLSSGIPDYSFIYALSTWTHRDYAPIMINLHTNSRQIRQSSPSCTLKLRHTYTRRITKQTKNFFAFFFSQDERNFSTRKKKIPNISRFYCKATQKIRMCLRDAKHDKQSIYYLFIYLFFFAMDTCACIGMNSIHSWTKAHWAEPKIKATSMWCALCGSSFVCWIKYNVLWKMCSTAHEMTN